MPILEAQVCFDETHLIGDNNIVKIGYIWFGQNRKYLHFKARKGSGGVGFLVKNALFETFQIKVCDDSYEGILWLEMINKQTKTSVKLCVCYPYIIHSADYIFLLIL